MTREAGSRQNPLADLVRPALHDALLDWCVLIAGLSAERLGAMFSRAKEVLAEARLDLNQHRSTPSSHFAVTVHLGVIPPWRSAAEALTGAISPAAIQRPAFGQRCVPVQSSCDWPAARYHSISSRRD